MSNTELITLIVGMFAVTFGVRYPLLAFSRRLQLSGTVLRLLAYVPPAVLSAIIFPMVLQPNGELELNAGNPYLYAAVVAVATAALRAPLVAVILGGMTAFYAARFIILA